MPAPPPTPRQRLARAIEVERARWTREVSQSEFARRAGIARSTADVVLHGRDSGDYRPTTLAGVDHAMGWAPGSAEKVMQGGRPKSVPDRERQELLDLWPLLGSQARRTVLEVARAAVRRD